MPRISDFPIKNTPSTSAMLSGVDNGENIQIPVDKFVTKNEDGGLNITANHIHMGQEDGKAVIDFLGENYIEIVGENVSVNGLRSLSAPDSNGSENLSYGNAGQVLMSNGDNVYWGDAPSASNSNCNTFAYTVEDTTTMADLINDMTAKGYTIGDKAILTLKGSISGTFAGYISTSAGNTLFIFNWIEVSTLTRYKINTNRYTTATVTESFETATKTLSSGIDVFPYATSGGDLLSSVINTVLSTNINTKGFMLNLTGAYSGIYYCSASRDSGSIYNFTLTDLVDLKSYKVSHMDTTGITLSEFFSNYEVKQESSGSSRVNVSADDYTYMSTVKETIVSAGKAPEEPTLVKLNGYDYDNMLLIWFYSVGGDYSYVHCWDLTNGKHYRTNEPIELSTIHINDFLSSTYEVPFGSSKQQVVKVDVTDLLATQNVELFKALTELYMNGNIVIVASLDGVNVVVSYVDLISADEATWGVSLPIPTYNDDEGITEVSTITYLIRYKDGVLTYLTKELSSDGSTGNPAKGFAYSVPVSSTTMKELIDELEAQGYTPDEADAPMLLTIRGAINPPRTFVGYIHTWADKSMYSFSFFDYKNFVKLERYSVSTTDTIYNALQNATITEIFSKSYNDLTDKPTIPSVDGLASESYVDTKVAEITAETWVFTLADGSTVEKAVCIK